MAIAKALVAVLVVGLVASTAAIDIVRTRRAELSSASGTGVSTRADKDDFWPKSLATWATHTPLFQSANYLRGINHMYDTSGLQLADKNDFDAAVGHFATYHTANSGLNLNGITINVNALIAGGGKSLDQLNFEQTQYYQQNAAPKFSVFKFANGAGAKVMWDDTTNPTILTPWLAGVQDGLAILRKHNVQPPANKVIDIHLAKWQNKYKIENTAIKGDSSTPALADAQAWHWSTSGIILTTGSLTRKDCPYASGTPYGVADQVLDAENARRTSAKVKQPVMNTAEAYRLRATYNLIHEFVHALHAQTPASRPVFFETQKSNVNAQAVLGNGNPEPWKVVSCYIMQMKSPREFVAEVGTKILAIKEKRLAKSQLSPKIKNAPAAKHLEAYRAFGGDAVVPIALAK